MRIYLAMPGWCNTWAEDLIPERVLLSYYHFRNIDKFHSIGRDIFIDSGAYSAWQLGDPVSLVEYGKFLLGASHKATVYANLDDILSVAATERHQKYLEGLGLNPLPVFHMGEPYEVLEELCSRYKLVCCGGTGTVMGQARGKLPARMWHFSKVFEMASKYGTKVHGFGVTDFAMLKAFP